MIHFLFTQKSLTSYKGKRCNNFYLLKTKKLNIQLEHKQAFLTYIYNYKNMPKQKSKQAQSTYSQISRAQPPIDLSFKDIFETYGIYFAHIRKTTIKPCYEKEASEQQLPEWNESNNSDIDYFTYDNLETNFKRIKDPLCTRSLCYKTTEKLYRGLFWVVGGGLRVALCSINPGCIMDP